MGTFYCSVCKQTTFSGKSHIFGKSHQSRLRVVLLKFLEKVKEARRTLKKPQVEKFDSTQHYQKFWCYCCQLEVDKNVTDGNMTVLHGGLIEHMATQEHRKNTHKFWWENKADQKLKDKVFFSVEETDRFKVEVEKVLETFVEKEDNLIKLEVELIRAQEKHRQEILETLTEVCLRRMYLEYPSTCNRVYNFTVLYIWLTNACLKLLIISTTTSGSTLMLDTEIPKRTSPISYDNAYLRLVVTVNTFPSMKYCWLFLKQQQHKAEPESSNNYKNENICAEDGASGSVLHGATHPVQNNVFDAVTEVPYATARLTFIGYQDSSSYGNIHTGAVPPWLQDGDDDPQEGGSESATQPEMGPSLQGFLKHKEQEKLKKLPPNRVGANFDHSSQTDANWLPSFGRVWNSGRRWQSRYQFRQEEGQKNKRKREREPDTDET